MAKNTLVRLRKKEREQRQSLIIEAARDVFGEKTFDQVSMAEIAKTAGIGKSSIYTYFRNQEELYASIVCQDIRIFIRDLEKKWAASIKNGENGLGAVIDFFLSHFIEKHSLWRMITHFALHGTRDTAGLEQLDQVGRDLMNVMDQVFVRAGFHEDPRLSSHTLFACLSGILIAFRNYPGRSETQRIQHMEKIGRQVEKLFITSLAERE